MADVDLERMIDERARAIVAEREAAKEAAEAAKRAAEVEAVRTEEIDTLRRLVPALRGRLVTLRPAWAKCALSAVGLFLFLGTSLIGLLHDRERSAVVAILGVELGVSIVASVVLCWVTWKRRLAETRSDLAGAENELRALETSSSAGESAAPYR